MNAHKFVADFRIEKAKAVLEVAPKDSLYLNQLTGFYYKIKCDDVMYGSDDESKGGWVVSTWPIEDLGRSKHTISLEKLKQVVESLKLVEIHSYEKSKEIVKNAPSDDHFYSWKLGNSGVYDKTVNIGELKQAIADYESIYGGEHV